MIHTIQTAGKATFFTSLTTAAAYAANIFSQVHCSFGIWGSLFLPEALIEREAASTIFLPSHPAQGHAGLACPRGLSLTCSKAVDTLPVSASKAIFPVPLISSALYLPGLLTTMTEVGMCYSQVPPDISFWPDVSAGLLPPLIPTPCSLSLCRSQLCMTLDSLCR